MIDVESFTALLVDCYQRLWLIAAAVAGDRAEADDIVQEASIIGLRKRADFAAGSNFAAWMSQIVRLTALNHRRKLDRRNLCVTDPAKFDQVISSGASDFDGTQLPLTDDGRLREHQADFDDEVLFALSEIGDVARACLLLRVVGQLAYGDIAQTLRIPSGTVMSHVHRAKQSIRERLKNHNVQSAQCRVH